MRTAATMGYLISGAKAGAPATIGEGFSRKTTLAAHFRDEGEMRLVRQPGMPDVVVHEDDENFEAKSMLALTILRASFQNAPVLDEKQAAEELRLPSLPSGFYVLSPGLRPKIAAAYLPEVAGGEVSPHAQFAEMFEDLVESKHAEPNGFATRFVVDPERFSEARDPFADYMSIGAGKNEVDKARARKAATRTSLADYGLLVETSSGGGDPLMGYPAPLRLAGELSRDPYPAEPDDIDGSVKRASHTRRDVSIMSTAAQMANLSIYNHNAASSINNIRDIQDVLDRAKAREAILGTMVDAWMARESIAEETRDETMSMAKIPPNKRRVVANATASNEVKAFGKARNYFVKQGQTASYSDEGKTEHLVLSMDQALVDGQHSSRDYALIAQGCLGAESGATPAYMGKEVPDCAPEALAEMVWGKYLERWASHGINPMGIDARALETAHRLGENPKDEEVKKRLAAASEVHGKIAQKARREVWASFSKFAPTLPVEVNISATMNPLMALVYMEMQNNSAPPRPEAKAMASQQALVQRVVSMFNETAQSLGDPIRLSSVKSQHANPDMSTADEPAQLTRDFMDIFPYVRAVSNSAGTSFHSHWKVEDSKGGSKLDQAEEWAKWEAVAVFDRLGCEMPSVKDQIFKDVEQRLKALYLAVDSLKSRNFELTEDNLERTGARLTSPATVAPQMKEFAKVMTACAAKILNVIGVGWPQKRAEASGKKAASTLPEDADGAFDMLSLAENDPKRVYAACRIAMNLKDTLRPQRRDVAPLKVMNDASLDNIMLSLLTTVAAVEQKSGMEDYAHPASPRAAQALGQARDRLVKSQARNKDMTFNTARESFLTMHATASAAGGRGAFQKAGVIGEQVRRKAREGSTLVALFDSIPGAAELMFDAIPGRGLGWADIEKMGKAPASKAAERQAPEPAIATPEPAAIKDRLAKSRTAKASDAVRAEKPGVQA